jgi:hypothetical protein
MGKDEESTDRELDRLANAVGKAHGICREWYTHKASGTRRRCTKKRGHWGKHG